ncbi:hypothetical protein JB92DRAFT_3035690 [Gautieria morchelliformis]|nr:hypothetical protein JB92DRAFT_3035690 [Gautieria morchelliformis]
MRHLSLQSVSIPHFSSLPRTPRPVTAVLAQRTATVQSRGTSSKSWQAPRASSTNPPANGSPSVLPQCVPLWPCKPAVFTGVSQAPSAESQNPTASKPHTRYKPQTSKDCDNSAWWQPYNT